MRRALAIAALLVATGCGVERRSAWRDELDEIESRPIPGGRIYRETYHHFMVFVPDPAAESPK